MTNTYQGPMETLKGQPLVLVKPPHCSHERSNVLGLGLRFMILWPTICGFNGFFPSQVSVLESRWCRHSCPSACERVERPRASHSGRCS